MNILRSSRNIEQYHSLSWNWSILVLVAGLLLTDVAVGEDKAVRFTAGTPGSAQYSPLTPGQLEQLVGPIALYPDDLIGIILPATTNPIQVVQAVRFLDEHETDPDLTPDDTWDESILALLNYPEVLRMMDENLDWTVKLGEAVIGQQDQLMDAIQQFRRRANDAGNLRSDDKQTVAKEGDTIEIRPADPEVIYVPSYEPDQVIVRHYVPLYDYSPIGYPVYYYPYAPDYSFSSGFFWGVTTAFIVNWNSHYIHAYGSNNFQHPYYRSNYYTNRFLFPNRSINRNRNRNRSDWRTSGYTRRSGYDRDHRTVTVGSLPQLQNRQIRQSVSTKKSTGKLSLSTKRATRRYGTTPGGRDVHRNQHQQYYGTVRRAGSFNNRTSTAWAQRRYSINQQNRNFTPRVLPHTSTTEKTPAYRTRSGDNHNSSTQSGSSRHSNNDSRSTSTRLWLRTNNGVRPR